MSHHHVLQNGSDIRGIAIATDEYAVNLTQQATKEVVRGLIHWLTQKPELAQSYQKGQLTIGIGRDSRLSGPDLVSAFTEEAVRLGVQLLDFGMATTPALFMSTQYPQFKCHAGVMITASHLPYYFNGIKIFRKMAEQNMKILTLSSRIVKTCRLLPLEVSQVQT